MYGLFDHFLEARWWWFFKIHQFSSYFLVPSNSLSVFKLVPLTANAGFFWSWLLVFKSANEKHILKHLYNRPFSPPRPSLKLSVTYLLLHPRSVPSHLKHGSGLNVINLSGGSTLVLKSEGAVKQHQADVLGVYRMVDSYNERPVYKQDGGENYIYYRCA